jgi:hypothetical protein
LNSMDVFLKEPLLDWQKFARRQAKATKEKGEVDIGTYAKEKLSVAKSKLERKNPSRTRFLSGVYFYKPTNSFILFYILIDFCSDHVE